MSVLNKAKNFGLAALVAGSMLLSRCGNDAHVDPISHFDDEKVLVACENEYEYTRVFESLRYRNSNRPGPMKMRFIQRKDYLKVIVPNIEDGSIVNSYLHVVEKKNLKDVLSKMENDGIFYDIVQLRGHTKDMRRLYSMTKDCSEYYSIYLFGGCNSDAIAESKQRHNRGTGGGNGVQDSEHNTYLLLQTINLIGSERAKSWDEFAENLRSLEPDFNNHYIPKGR